MLKCELVPLWHIDSAFEQVAQGLQKSCDRSGGDLDAAYLHQQCRSSASMLVIASNDTDIIGAVVLRFENWSGKSVLRTLALWCNGLGVWDALDAKAHEIGRQFGAKSLVAEGRKGWERRYPNAKVIRQLYEIGLDDGR
jgi:hypothetical protein